MSLRVAPYAMWLIVGVCTGTCGLCADLDLLTATSVARIGSAAKDQFGSRAVSCDLNGDSVPDLAVGAYESNGLDGTRPFCGEVRVFFGRRGAWSGTFSAQALADVRIVGIANSDAGVTLACGDLDGDGSNDLAVAAYNADGPGGRTQSGAVTIIRGRTLWPSVIDLASGSNTTVYGPVAGAALAGRDIAAGDLNGDGIADLVMDYVGAPPRAGGAANAGRVYVLFGRRTWPATIDLASGGDVALFGRTSGDFFGMDLAVSDLDRDGIADLLVAANFADGPQDARTDAGEIHVFRGRTTWPAIIDLKSSNSDMMLFGADPGDRLGDSQGLNIADTDGDGWPDIWAGAYLGAGTANTAPLTGELRSYEPRTVLAGNIDLRVSSKNVIYGPAADTYFGTYVRVGDTNGDGTADLMAGATRADGPGGTRTNCGEVEVLLGRSGFPAIFNLALTPPDLRIIGAAPDDRLGVRGTVDINGDGYADIVANSALGSSTVGPSIWLVSSLDSDADGVQQLADNCPLVYNPDQLDTDGDRRGDACQLDWDGDGQNDSVDCAPANAQAGSPGEVDHVRFADKNTLVWDSLTFGDRYDVVRGSVSALPSHDFGNCIDSQDANLADTTITDAQVPAPSVIATYLVRGHNNTCGKSGTWGRASDGQERVNLNTASCP